VTYSSAPIVDHGPRLTHDRRTDQSPRPARPLTYTHVIVATGNKLVFIAGQEPEDRHGNLVGPGDLALQARQVFGNVGRALAAAGARPGQVTKITIFVVHHRPEYLPVIEAARAALFGDHKPADTVVGVEALSSGAFTPADSATSGAGISRPRWPLARPSPDFLLPGTGSG
jgi:enamine deaminase RidA (YjgF/YER057c/UK114 family)